MNPPLLTLKILGHAEPAGSKRAFAIRKGNGDFVLRNGVPAISVVDDNPKSKGWKKLVAAEARKLWRGRDLLEGPVRLDVTFVRPRPGYHFGTGRNAGVLKPDAPTWCTVKPDALKLARAVEDALTGVVWKDDAQIVDERLLKAYGAPEGVLVRIFNAGVGVDLTNFFAAWK